MNHEHLVNHIQNPCVRSQNKLYVIGVISNPIRVHSRLRIFRNWLKAMEKIPHVQVCIVEAAYGDRHHECTEKDNPWHLQVRTHDEIWIKENMINLAFHHLLPRDWKYAAWVDTDVFFRDDNWAQETIQQLQHYEVVQPWSHCSDLGPHGDILQTFKSFGYQHQRRAPKQMHPTQPYEYAHTGYAWACTRNFYENLPGKGLMDFPILGSADHHMAFAMIGEVKNTIHAGMQPSFFRRCFEWQLTVLPITNKEVGFVHGRIEHDFHGSKKRRYYRERWEILTEFKFDPDTDLRYNHYGVLQLVGKPALEHEIHRYNLSRMEDSNET